jgi:hypothetical protein
MQVTVPVNTTAKVHVPGDGQVRLDGRVAGQGEGVVLELGSGSYRIETRPLEPPEPSLALSVSPAQTRVAPGATATFTVDVDGLALERRSGEVRAVVPEGWSATPETAEFELAGTGWPESERATFEVTVPRDAAGGNYPIRFVTEGAEASTVVSVPSLEGTVFLSDLPWRSESNGYGPAERDRANGELGADDGGPLSLDGTAYEKGIGAHAPSEIVIDLAGRCEQFAATVGVDDSRGSNGSIAFRVLADGTEVASTPVLTGASSALDLQADVSGAERLTLIVTNGGDNTNHDHANWAAARLRC